MSGTLQAAERPEGASTLLLSVPGMTCSNCVRHVTEALREVPGVRRAEVSLENQTAAIHLDSSVPLKIPALLEAVAEAGYPASVIDQHAKAKRWSPLSG